VHNRQTEAARRFHRLTRQALQGTKLRQTETRLSRAAKTYGDLSAVPLERDFSLPAVPALSAVAAPESTEDNAPTLKEVSGALFSISEKPAPIEIYMVCADLPDLEAGVYHFHKEEFVLRKLRAGDYRPELAGAAGDNQAVAAAPVTIVLGAVFDRTVWRDHARAYPSCLLDCGRAAADLLTVMAAGRIPCSVELGFVDSKVNHLLGLDGHGEASLCLLPLGRSLEWAGHAVGREIAPLSFAGAETACPSAGEMHGASALVQDDEVRPWRGSCVKPPAVSQDRILPFNLAPRASLPLAEVMTRGGSPRRCAAPPGSAELSAILWNATRGVPADFLDGPETSLLDLYLVVDGLEGLDPGAYFFSPAGKFLEEIRSGNVRAEAAGPLFADSARGAGAAVFLMSDLDAALERFGNRAYRALHIEAGILAEKLSLCARSLKLDAASLAFDEETAAAFFSSHTAGKEAIYALAITGS
jgi:SagB-type dehydrogenase family enzyme